jgi:membrane-bound lytic murein transglycosylase D
MVQTLKVSQSMAIRTPFLAAAVGFSMVLASGALAPVAADPYPEPLTVEEFAPASSSPEALGQSESVVDLSIDPSVSLSLQRLDEEPSSGSGPSDPGGLQPRSEVSLGADPWAEAMADAARLSRLHAVEAPSFPVVINAQVQQFLDRFTGTRRDTVGLWLSRSTRYLGMIRDVLRTQGLPEDLAFVAMIESGYNPLAVSRAGAKGLWQFMAGTARRYGLRVDQWVDERFDPEKSTTAAAAYLRDLHRQFGSWPLAKAAYNAGEVTVTRAVRGLGTNDFWTIAASRFLKNETKQFVPAIHAATVIGRDPGRFGFEPSESASPATEVVPVPGGTNLRTLAAGAGMGPEALQKLNPVLVKGVTPPGPAYDLKVPAGAGARVAAVVRPPTPPAPAKSANGTTAAKGSTGEVHLVRPGDTLSGIAKQHGVSASDLIRWNRIERPDRIRPGDRLRVTEIRLSAAERRHVAGGP